MKWQMGPKWHPVVTILPTKIKMTNKADMILKVLTDTYNDNFVRAYHGVFGIFLL